MPRPKWDAFVAQLILGSDAQVRNFTRTGQLHGFWEVFAGHGPGNHGWVALCAPAPDAAHQLAPAAAATPA